METFTKEKTKCLFSVYSFIFLVASDKRKNTFKSALAIMQQRKKINFFLSRIA